jgi:hypothetical protein
MVKRSKTNPVSAEKIRSGMMSPKEHEMLDELLTLTVTESDGHLTIMKFTTNWRVALWTPEHRDQIPEMFVRGSRPCCYARYQRRQEEMGVRAES